MGVLDGFEICLLFCFVWCATTILYRWFLGLWSRSIAASSRYILNVDPCPALYHYVWFQTVPTFLSY